MSRHLSLALLTILMAPGVLPGCGSSSANYLRERAAAKKAVATSGLRTTVARQLIKAKKLRGQGTITKAVTALRVAASFSSQLQDDILIRDASTHFSANALPPGLRRTRAIMLAQRAFAAGDLRGAKSHLSPFTIFDCGQAQFGQCT